ncbi:MAG: signal peptidase I [Anaerolineae bacterium]|nr:signal peptidase I [Anaerolineae bacterium]
MTLPQAPRPRLRVQGRLREFINLGIFLLAVYTLLEIAIPRSVVLSISMEPNLIAEQRLLISRVSYLFGEPQRGEIVVFESPSNAANQPPLIKRLIGLPGETIEFRDGAVYINGIELHEPYINEPCWVEKCKDASWTLGQDEYFLMGDNRNHSHDSRAFGAIHRDQLIGRAILRWWPPAKWGILGYDYD